MQRKECSEVRESNRMSKKVDKRHERDIERKRKKD